MADPKQLERAERVFQRNEKREAEINEALKHEALATMPRLRTCIA
jgi:hypothetical protein